MKFHQDRTEDKKVMALDNSGMNAVWADKFGTTQKGVNSNFSSREFDKPYSVRKLSISDA